MYFSFISTSQFSLSSSSGPSAAAAPASTPVATLVRNVLLEGHTTTNEYKYDKYTLKWVYHSDLQLYFVAVHLTQLALKFLYLDEFLERIRNEFVKEYKVEIESFAAAEQFSGFQRRYDRLLGDMLEKSSSVKKAPRSFEETAKGMNVDRDTVQGKKEMERRRLKLEKEKSEEAGDESQSDEGPNSPTAADGPASPSSASEPGFNPDKLKMLQKRQGPMRTGPPKKKDKSGPKSPESGSAAEDSAGKPIRKGKVMAQSDKATKKDMAALDFSKQLNADERLAADVEKIREVMGEAPKDSKVYEYQDEEEEDQNDEPEEEEDEKESSDQAKSGGIFGFFKSLVGAKELTREDLENVMKGVKATLMERNVAADIAEKVCESVTQSLIGKKVGSFTTIRSTVKSAMEESLTKILTPTKQVDLLEGIAAAQAQHRPYTIVFVGVNGVGKSTSLSKICAYFLSKSLKVGMVAGDTFRSGAIEQLRTHATCLNVPLYAKGYERDAALVAADGILQAKRDGLDVVLIDTAGRMQDNEPLMRALSKLINLNKPDLILFVGEALVGNEAVDQAAKFNGCLRELSSDSTPRLIDGIVLTKFDTIDDKVGAAISMAYTTGKPIVFVGTGQTYEDLKRMNVKTLVKALLK